MRRACGSLRPAVHTPSVPESALLEAVVETVVQASWRAVATPGRGEFRCKGDGSIVTPADVAVEDDLRRGLAKLVPGAAFWGEEGGHEPESAEGLWLVDPIDGTTNFAYRIPLWGTSVALMRGGRLALGVVALPEMDIVLAARDGGGATLGGAPLARRPSAPIEPYEPVGRERPGDLVTEGKARHFGSIVVEAAFTALGMLRAFSSDRCKLYDVAGSLAVLREVGMEARHADGRLLDESRWVVDTPIEPFAVRSDGG
jgi:myo-inositol-1(or 4)-monophosphatase